jgi:hypothetical protein
MFSLGAKIEAQEQIEVRKSWSSGGLGKRPESKTKMKTGIG